MKILAAMAAGGVLALNPLQVNKEYARGICEGYAIAAMSARAGLREMRRHVEMLPKVEMSRDELAEQLQKLTDAVEHYVVPPDHATMVDADAGTRIECNDGDVVSARR